MIYFNILDLYAEKGSVFIKRIFDGLAQNTKHKLKLIVLNLKWIVKKAWKKTMFIISSAIPQRSDSTNCV